VAAANSRQAGSATGEIRRDRPEAALAAQNTFLDRSDRFLIAFQTTMD
jgi:hypothetical protein